MSASSPPADSDRKVYLISELPEDLVELLLTQEIPDDLPDYDPYDPSDLSEISPSK